MIQARIFKVEDLSEVLEDLGNNFKLKILQDLRGLFINIFRDLHKDPHADLQGSYKDFHPGFTLIYMKLHEGGIQTYGGITDIHMYGQLRDNQFLF